MAEWTLDKVRETFLNYFKEKGHTIVESSPLLPAEDKTLLFANAGMNQFKNVFLGQEKRSYSRAATAQKCVRAGGKHNDLENVGFTARHHTFFEMLGNFSFGDYFKKEAVSYAWELVTEVFKLDKSRLYVTIYKDDDEAFKYWREDIGVPAERIFRLGDKDNFWAMGDTGPCGPCSEIHYDMGADFPCENPFNGIEPNWDCGRFVEIWNLVFMQYNRDESGKLTPLPKPSIDTGMGLERLTAALNGFKANYETDMFAELIRFIKTILPENMESHPETSFRVIADHARATSFLIADSITPSNEGRGYVLRRIMRRAIRHGHKLGFTEIFFHKVCMKVIELMGHHYAELISRRELIRNIVIEEEKRFRQTLDKGLALLSDGIAKASSQGKTELSGDLVFKLYDTYGFPSDLTQSILDEEKMTFSREDYEKAMKQQQERGKASWSSAVEEKKLLAAAALKSEGIDSIPFDGYDKAELVGEILALFNENFDRVDSVCPGIKAYVVITPLLFYAESGGQAADKGTLEREDKKLADITDCIKIGEYRAVLVITEESMVVGTKVIQKLESERRDSIRKNHSATHLLHLSLNRIIGEHAHQAGSLVTSERLRFDFTHYKALSKDELREIEKVVNILIQQNYKVCTEIKAIEDAKKDGATALFGEKYGETVRVVSMGDSKELCGGTHVERTGQIGLFKIIKEEGIAAGVRRIEAVTAMNAFDIFQQYDDTVAACAEMLGVEKATVISGITKLKDTFKAQQKQTEELMAKISSIEAGNLKPTAAKDGIDIYIIDSGKDRNGVSKLSDSLKSQIKDGLFIITGMEAEKGVAAISCSGKAKDLYDAGAILREMLAAFGGKGGGKKDMAQGGAPVIDAEKWKEKALSILKL